MLSWLNSMRRDIFSLCGVSEQILLRRFLSSRPRFIDVGESDGRILATILFNDIVDSTKLQSQFGDKEWRDKMDQFNALAQMDHSLEGRYQKYGRWNLSNLRRSYHVQLSALLRLKKRSSCLGT